MWIAGASAAAAVLLSGILVYPGLHRSKRTAVPGSQDTSALSLRVERSSGELLLTWNRDSEAIRNAAHAVLSISDGDRHENVDMDLAQLRNGSIVYSPSTGDVVFQMAVTGKNSSQLQSESVRVLRTRPSPMPDDQQQAASSKQAPAPPKQATADPAPLPEPQPETPAPKPAATPVRAFQMESLAQRLRPARSWDLPDAPGLTGTQSGGFALPNENLTAPAPPPAPGAAIPAVTPTPAPAASAAVASAQSAKLGGQVHEATLVSRINPEYPSAARQARVEGTVVVLATVGKDGKVTAVRAVSGPPLLQNMAVTSVREWVYKPATLNGAPIESETRVELKFTLGR